MSIRLVREEVVIIKAIHDKSIGEGLSSLSSEVSRILKTQTAVRGWRWTELNITKTFSFNWIELKIFPRHSSHQQLQATHNRVWRKKQTRKGNKKYWKCHYNIPSATVSLWVMILTWGFCTSSPSTMLVCQSWWCTSHRLLYREIPSLRGLTSISLQSSLCYIQNQDSGI